MFLNELLWIELFWLLLLLWFIFILVLDWGYFFLRLRFALTYFLKLLVAVCFYEKSHLLLELFWCYQYSLMLGLIFAFDVANNSLRFSFEIRDHLIPVYSLVAFVYLVPLLDQIHFFHYLVDLCIDWVLFRNNFYLELVLATGYSPRCFEKALTHVTSWQQYQIVIIA